MDHVTKTKMVGREDKHDSNMIVMAKNYTSMCTVATPYVHCKNIYYFSPARVISVAASCAHIEYSTHQVHAKT